MTEVADLQDANGIDEAAGEPDKFSDAALDNSFAEDDGSVKKKVGLLFWVSVGWLVLVCALAYLAPWIPFVEDPEDRVGGKFDGPSGSAWFGTDQLGRDVFSRIVFGARVSLTIGFVSIVLGMLLGGFLGIVSGFVGGALDKAISFIFAVMLSFPSLILAILIVSFVDRSLLSIAGVLGIVAIAPIGLLARAQTLNFAEREFVTAARGLGAKRGRIMLREILPNVAVPMGVLALLGMALSIVAEGGLAFLSLSVESGPTWGKILATSTDSRTLENNAHIAIFMIAVFFVTILALNLAGDKLREYFDVRDISV